MVQEMYVLASMQVHLGREEFSRWPREATALSSLVTRNFSEPGAHDDSRNFQISIRPAHQIDAADKNTVRATFCATLARALYPLSRACN